MTRALARKWQQHKHAPTPLASVPERKRKGYTTQAAGFQTPSAQISERLCVRARSWLASRGSTRGIGMQNGCGV